MRRRGFVGLLSAPLLAQSPNEPLPQFPTWAHQLVWRNWDLVPVARIALTLACRAATVIKLAQQMHLPRQSLEARYARRQRFLILRRNWTFVPTSQLTVLANMAPAEITELLAEDAFYNGHLGPSPAIGRIQIGPARRLKLDYVIRSTGPVAPRFDFTAGLNRDKPSTDLPAPGSAFGIRIGFPYPLPTAMCLGIRVSTTTTPTAC